jgi:hypothetical protein
MRCSSWATSSTDASQGRVYDAHTEEGQAQEGDKEAEGQGLMDRSGWMALASIVVGSLVAIVAYRSPADICPAAYCSGSG